jgi:multidrug efflux pump subunit AcrA (membrane-fusion protein)
MNKKLLSISKILGLILALALFSCGDNKKEKAAAVADSLAKATPLEINKVMGIAIIEPADQIAGLASESNGIIEKINVKAGESVSAGQIILSLNNDLEIAQIQQAQSKIGTQKQAIATAEAHLSLLKNQNEKAKRDLIRDQGLFGGKALTQQALDNSIYALENIEKQIVSQKVAVEQEKAKILEINADIKYYQALLSKKIVKAPQAGVLLSLNVHLGEFLATSQSIADFAPNGPAIALTEIDELFALKVKIGQKAEIKNQGSGDVRATGTVILTSPYLRKKSLFSENSSNLEDRRVREVRVQLDDASKVILGARVECWIDTKN